MAERVEQDDVEGIYDFAVHKLANPGHMAVYILTRPDGGLGYCSCSPPEVIEWEYMMPTFSNPPS